MTGFASVNFWQKTVHIQ